MRLNWFLPFLRVSKKGPPRKTPGLLVRAVAWFIPKRWQSDPVTGKRGLVRRMLKKISPAWFASPLRKVCQAVCFIAFLYLFIYVCFPYTAKPAKDWHGWLPVEVDSETGNTTLHHDRPTLDGLALGNTIHIVDPSTQTAPLEKPESLGEFRITAITDNDLTLTPVESLKPEQLEKLSFSLGPLSLHERNPADWPSNYADDLAAKEKVNAEAFLIIDPLLSISTALAAKAWVWSLVWAGIILLVCIFIPRGFCGYICPLGTLIDLFDWSIGKRITRFRVADEGWWVHIKYYVLMGTLIAAMCGVLFSGIVAAIPIITRGLLFIIKPFQDASARGWHNVPPINAGHIVSLVLFFGVLAMGFWKPRFWCKYVCPSGAVFSIGNLFRATERKVESSCIKCNKCVEICPFDAIKPDFTTRTTDCTLCQTCGGACPVDAIKFVDRWNKVELKILNDPPTNETPIGRRGFLAAGVGIASAVAGGTAAALATRAMGARLDDPASALPVRPPGSVPEQEFLQMCIRCGECFKACPNDVLQPMSFEQGLEGLWTPQVVADWAGCEVSCNNCGQVCPTGAIRALPLLEKKAARMGLAIVNDICLPIAGREECRLCIDECDAAGYYAIEVIRVGTKGDADGNPIEGTGFDAPVVRADLCVGCGLCQTRCYAINVAEKSLIDESAIIIEAGEGKEDRMMSGSYVLQRKREKAEREEELRSRSAN